MPTYETSESQRAQLLQQGYTFLPNAVPPKLLKQWQDIASRLESEALTAHQNGEQLHGACVIEDSVGPRLMRYDDILATDTDALLDLLACPAMMAVARDFCGRGCVPMQADVLYKHQHPHPVILWHQGAPHSRAYPYLNVGIYLDDAPKGDGCLRYVPGTQHELQNICDLATEHGWEIPGVVELPAKAGDILIQDMMILHGSQPKRSPGVRRTIYVELRPSPGITAGGEQSDFWAELRERWMSMVVARADESDWPEEWKGDLPTNLHDTNEEIAQIMANHEPPIPAVYCHQPFETDDYPVPADLKE